MGMVSVLYLTMSIFLFKGNQVRGNRFPDTKQSVSSVVGCDADLIWESPEKDYRMSIAKIKNSKEEQLDNNIKKYWLERTPRNVILTIKELEMKDAGYYRITIGSKHEDINLIVTDFQWKNNVTAKYVRVGDTIDLCWEFVTKRPADTIRLYRAAAGIRQVLARWENGNQQANIADGRIIQCYFHKYGNGDTYRAYLTLPNITIDDFKYEYIIEVAFNDICLKTEEPVHLKREVNFKWMSSPNPVNSTIKDDVKLVWKYDSSELANKIILTRYSNITKERKQLGIWNFEKGFQSKVEGIKFNKSNTNQEVNIIMTIQNANKDAFDHFYECQVFYGVFFNSVSGIELVPVLPHIYSDTMVVKSRPTEDVKFVWHFRYAFPVLWVRFRRSSVQNGPANAEYDIGHWHNETFTPKLTDNGGKRIEFNKTEGDGDGQITLSLLNTTKDDFSKKYYIIYLAFKDLGFSESHCIILKGNICHSVYPYC
ncbi:uncharacterized protein LOC126830611 [Patella vulgata]|uniref:uncharacterized protein LOC126830611 n=1 Tax=Patella vulgata TaxID=6465 RepID=UPI0024A8963A|nr:uncharacterized protein LOC126830611 [Patella vulgata]